MPKLGLTCNSCRAYVGDPSSCARFITPGGKAAQQVKRSLPWLRFAGLSMIVLALARPQHGLSDFRIRTEGIAIMMCIDRSGSMQALDFTLDSDRVDRLTAVKDVFNSFVTGDGGLSGRPNDQIGLVSSARHCVSTMAIRKNLITAQWRRI